MQFTKMIQYVCRYKNYDEAQKCLEALSILHGFVTGRAYESPDSMGYAAFPWVAQAFFECHDDVNPEAISSCLGLRVVLVPPNMLAAEIRQENPAKK